MVAMNDIQAVVDRIAQAFDPQRIVLFGFPFGGHCPAYVNVAVRYA